MKRITFEPDPRRPRNALNTVPLYAVTWDTKTSGLLARARIRRTGNSWRNRAEAERVYRRMEALGRNPAARLQYCAGFA